MTAAADLYQEVILDHYKSPRNHRVLDPADRVAEGDNPMCGDEVTLYLTLDGDRIREATFQGSGCAISKASASLMTTVLPGRTMAEAEELFHTFHDVLTGKVEPDLDTLGKLAVFAGVSEFPARVKCASLAWHTLQAALAQKDAKVSTE